MDTGKTRDMTKGSPMMLILGFAVPMLLGTLFQQFYSMVDTVIVGKFLGVNALAGVGSTGAINFMINGFVIGMCSGFAIPVAQRFGAQDHEGMRRYAANIIWLTIAFALVMTALIAVLTRRILVWMDTPEEILEYAYQYIFIIFLGIPVTFLYNVTASVIRSLGDSRTPAYFLVMASLINILLDYVSIVYLGFSVDGPAYATVISQGFSGVLCLIYMGWKFPILHLSREELRLDLDKCFQLLAAGIPMGLQYSITAIGSVVLQTAVNSLGAVAVASITAGNKIIIFFACVFDALGATMATYCGQNIGALRLDRIKEGVKDAMILGSIYSVIALLILAIFGNMLVHLFVAEDGMEMAKQAYVFIMIQVVFYVPLCAVNVYRFSLQGIGFSGYAMLAGVCEMIGRGIVGIIGIRIFGYYAACFAAPLAWIFADMFLIQGLYKSLDKLKVSYRV